MKIKQLRTKNSDIRLGDIVIVLEKREPEYFMIVYDGINKIYGLLDLDTYKVINSFFDDNIRHENLKDLVSMEINEVKHMVVDRYDCILDFKTENVF